MATLPLSSAKARLSEIADDVDRTHERVQITKHGRSYVVLIAAEDLEWECQPELAPLCSLVLAPPGWGGG